MKSEQLRNQKIGMFSERKNMDDMVEYARQLAGAEGVTVAMMTVNTMLELMAKQAEGVTE